MKKRDIIVILIVLLIVLVPIVLNEWENSKTRILKKQVSEIISIVSEFNKDLDKTVKYSIDNELEIDGTKYKIKGNGAVFADNNDIVVLISRGGYCGAKIPLSKDIIINEGDCPVYELINGIKSKIVTKGDGLYKVNDSYVYRGNNVDNYILFNDELWRILSVDSSGKIKIISDESIIEKKWNGYLDSYNYLDNVYTTFNDNAKKNIIVNSFNVGVVELSSNLSLDDLNGLEQKDKIDAKVGMLSFSDFIDSCSNDYKISNNTVMCGNSFIVNTMWIGNSGMNKKYYLYRDGNIYIDNINIERGIYPLIVLSAEVIAGDGTNQNPYIYK